jgi:hypothetical protein
LSGPNGSEALHKRQSFDAHRVRLVATNGILKVLVKWKWPGYTYYMQL